MNETQSTTCGAGDAAINPNGGCVCGPGLGCCGVRVVPAVHYDDSHLAGHADRHTKLVDDLNRPEQPEGSTSIREENWQLDELRLRLDGIERENAQLRSDVDNLAEEVFEDEAPEPSPHLIEVHKRYREEVAQPPSVDDRIKINETRVDKLCGDVVVLEDRVHEMASRLAEHDTALQGVAELRRQVQGGDEKRDECASPETNTLPSVSPIHETLSVTCSPNCLNELEWAVKWVSTDSIACQAEFYSFTDASEYAAGLLQ